jgi:hypothetical protein
MERLILERKGSVGEWLSLLGRVVQSRDAQEDMVTENGLNSLEESWRGAIQNVHSVLGVAVKGLKLLPIELQHQNLLPQVAVFRLKFWA